MLNVWTVGYVAFAFIYIQFRLIIKITLLIQLFKGELIKIFMYTFCKAKHPQKPAVKAESLAFVARFIAAQNRRAFG